MEVQITRPSCFSIGEWIVHPDRDLLVWSGRGRNDERRVTPLEMELLLRLSVEPGRVVSKTVLLDEVWRGAAVVDHVLAKTMSKLRASLDDDARNPRFIETVGRRGYRLLQEPRPAGRSASRSVQRYGLLARGRRLLPAAAVVLAFVGGLSVPNGEAPIELEVVTHTGSSESAPAGRASAILREELRVPVRISLPMSVEESGSVEAERYLWKFEVSSSPLARDAGK